MHVKWWGLLLWGASFVAQGEALQARGVVSALNQAELSVEIGARVVEIPFRKGESFKRGDLLLALDCALYEAQRDKVKADLEASQIRFDNKQRLLKSRSIGKTEVEIAQLALEKNRAEYQMVELNVSRCRLHSPWDGHVAELLVHKHEVVEANQQVMKIVAASSLEVEFVIPATWLQWLKVGHPYRMTIDETGEVVEGGVDVIGAVVDPVSQTISLRSSVQASASLLPGMSGTASFVR